IESRPHGEEQRAEHEIDEREPVREDRTRARGLALSLLALHDIDDRERKEGQRRCGEAASPTEILVDAAGIPHEQFAAEAHREYGRDGRRWQQEQVQEIGTELP